MEASIIWIFVTSFLDLLAVSLFIPLMSTRLKQLGASHFLIGCMTSIYALTQLVSGPIIGSWSDRIGRQKIFIFSLLAASFCYTFLGSLDSLFLIFILRAILGIFKHTQVLIRTIVTDKVPRGRQNLIFANLKALAGMSFTLGPAISGNLAEFENGYSYICYTVGGIFLLNSAIVYVFLNDLPPVKIGSQSEKDVDTVELNSSILEAISDLGKIDWPIYWDIFALKFLIDFSTGAFHNNYSLKLIDKFNISQKMAGYTISLQSFVAVLAGFFVDRITRRFYRNDYHYEKRNIHGYAIISITYVAIWATREFTVFIFWTMILKSVHMFLRIIMTEIIVERCPVNQKGLIMGTGNSVSNIARLITPLLSGIVEDLWGSNSSNILAAIAATFGLFVSFTLGRHRKKNDDSGKLLDGQSLNNLQKKYL